jgi:hypothetical protein
MTAKAGVPSSAGTSGLGTAAFFTSNLFDEPRATQKFPVKIMRLWLVRLSGYVFDTVA